MALGRITDEEIIKITDGACKNYNCLWADWAGVSDMNMEQLVMQIQDESINAQLKSCEAQNKKDIRAAMERVIDPMIEYLNEQIRQCEAGKMRTAAESPINTEARRAFKTYQVERDTLMRTLVKVEALKSELLGKGEK